MRHVLIVDDALSLGRLLKTALFSLDSTMPIVVVSSAEDAMLEGTRYPVDLLITDIQIQEILRVDLIERIRSRHPDLRVIVIGSIFDDESSKHVKDLNADAYFNKPLKISEFTAAARSLLGLGELEELPEDVEEDLEKSPTPTAHVVDILADFRRRSGALAVVLIDEVGKILTQAGELQEEIFQRWIPNVMSAADASTHLSRTLGKAVPENVMYISGSKYHLVMTPIYDVVLAAVLEESRPAQYSQVFEGMLEIRKTLEYIFRELGISSYPTEISEREAFTAEEVTEPAADLGESEDLSMLFEGEEGSVDKRQIDSFWESLPGESAFESNEPDTLSYDQAHQLGFTPEESEEE